MFILGRQNGPTIGFQKEVVLQHKIQQEEDVSVDISFSFYSLNVRCLKLIQIANQLLG